MTAGPERGGDEGWDVVVIVVVIVVAMGLVVGLALWIIAQAAYPAIRRGEEMLTPEGERLTRDAQVRARTAAARARRAVDVRGARASGGDDAADDAADGDHETDDAGDGEAARGERSSGRVDVDAATGSRSVAASQPPRQQNSPVATPASGVSGTITR